MRSAMGNYEGIINDSDDWPDSSRAILLCTGIDEGHRASRDNCMGFGIECTVTAMPEQLQSGAHLPAPD